ncbi:tripartite tricarboxylate transporter TctB family protein [Roseicella aerolata]|uniref:Tripartite tricarboxylate transporter TctB family protein n=1 Tax=Roseicella aerolata TaxID=2883479 RepID=A0A9X1L9N5_9PROT|nr:tripartite tricarboxylate transporter TctB family protein [Roseicella aerolata]MCB4821320.1 tripartite tricarboxylate transporter TctB family protein [Roseicella aerolata]
MRLSRDYVDVVGGVGLVLFGGWVYAHAAAEYDFGTLRRMGPGFFPAALAVLLMVFGALLAVPALFRSGEGPRISVRSFLSILAGILAFAWLIEPFGLVPATIALVGLAALAEPGFRPIRTALLAVALSALGVLIFSQGLGIPIPAFRWSPA